MPIPTQHEIDAAEAKSDEADAEFKRAYAAFSAALDAKEAAMRECLRLRTLATPLRDWPALQFRPAMTRRRPASLRSIAERSYPDQAEVKAALTELVAEGLVRQVGNGYDSRLTDDIVSAKADSDILT